MVEQSQNRWETSIYALSAGFIAGCALFSFTHRDYKAGVGILGAVAATGAAALVLAYQTDPSPRYQQEINQLKRQIVQAEAERDRFFADGRSALQQVQLIENTCNDIKRHNAELVAQLNQDRLNAAQTSSHHQKVVVDLTTQINALQANLERVQADSRAEIEKLNAELDEYDRTFDDRLKLAAAKEVDQFKRQQLEKIYTDFQSVSKKAIDLSTEYDRVAHTYHEKATGSQQTLERIVAHYTQRYQEAIDDRKEVEKAFLEEIELYQQKIIQLQRQQQGILLEPQYRDCGFSEAGRASEAVVRSAFNRFRIPLKMMGWTEINDGFCKFGLGASSDQNLDAVIAQLNNSAETIRLDCLAYAVPKFKRSELFDGIECSFQVQKKTQKADLSSILRSPEDFLKEMRSKRPFLRLIGEPGAGKTPVMKLILAEILRHGYPSETGKTTKNISISYCDILADASVKNTGELKFVTHFNSYKEAFKNLQTEFNFRMSGATMEYLSETAFVWICDEYDEAIAEEAERATKIRSIAKKGTHKQIGVIVLSQSDQLIQLKMNKSDLKLFRNVLIDERSIRGFLGAYGEDVVGKEKTEKLLADYNKILEEHKGLNEGISDTARHYRFGLVLDGQYSAFYQLPYFDRAEFDTNNYLETQMQIAEIRAQSTTQDDAEATQTSANSTQNPHSAVTQTAAQFPYMGSACPKCDRGVLEPGRKDRGVQYYACKDCGKNTSETVLKRQ